MEYMGGGEVKWNDGADVPRPILTIWQTRRIMRDVLLGLEYRQSTIPLTDIFH